MHQYQLHQEEIRYVIVLIGFIFLLTINMCDHGRTITHLQTSRFHTQVWYNFAYRISMSDFFFMLYFSNLILHRLSLDTFYGYIINHKYFQRFIGLLILLPIRTKGQPLICIVESFKARWNPVIVYHVNFIVTSHVSFAPNVLLYGRTRL